MVRHDFEPVFLRQDMQEVVTNSPKPIASDGLSSVTGPVVGRHDDNDGVFGHGTLTPEEVSQIQKLADEYNTQIDVIGSRAAGRGRNINTDFRAPSDIKGQRSDIDFRYDGRIDIETDGRFWKALTSVGNGTGSTAYDAGPGGSKPPVIEFRPNTSPIHRRC